MFARTLGLALTLGLPLVGCNAVDSGAEHTMEEQIVAQPDAIVVQEFALSPDAPQPTGATAGDDAAKAGQRFSSSLAGHLVTAIRKMGLPAVSADAPLPPAGGVVTLEGRFVSVPAGDSAEPQIVSLANAWPDVVVDVQIYDTSQTDDRLYEDMEIRISDTNSLMPGGEPADEATEPPAGTSAISPAIQAKLDAAAVDGADAIARQLAPFFADQGWIAHPAGS
jgi:hypothetical protein